MARIIFGIGGAALAWPLASIPIYYWRRQIMLEEQRIRTLAGGHTVAPRKFLVSGAAIALAGSMAYAQNAPGPLRDPANCQNAVQ
jgi:hypothetical protein